MATLRDAGFEPEAPDDPLAWLHDQQPAALIFTLLSDSDWGLLESLNSSTTDTLLVVLAERVTVETSVRAFRLGAACILPRSTSPAALSEAFSAALDGRSTISLDVLRALISPEPSTPSDEHPSNQEREWLRSLSRGVTVGQLALEAGYSERMMFRLLRNLYTRIGAVGRADALVTAQAKGWLGP
ncbi:DNA-binding response regulator [Micromonospora sp. NPDC005172]|uniref:DNA-binding response regulator n=1 Tax=Micromonospora sp. NPDC005172 TaxID=3156867 RepID=UPI0033B75FA2